MGGLGRKRKPGGEAKTTIFVNLKKKVVSKLEAKGNAGKIASEIIEDWYDHELKKEKKD